MKEPYESIAKMVRDPISVLKELVVGESYVHAKTQRVYEVIALASLAWTRQSVTVYRHTGMNIPGAPVGVTGATWVMPVAEFMDGRFVTVASTEEIDEA